MQKYSNNSVMSKFIKNLLYKTYIPTCGTVNQGDFIIEGFDYVYETNLIKCTKTGYIGGKFYQDIEYGTVTGKNQLYNRYLEMTKQAPQVNVYASEGDIPPDQNPFAVLDIPNRTLKVYYSLYKFTGDESYTLTSDGKSLILNNTGEVAKYGYYGLEDDKCYCNVLSKSASSDNLSYATITLFEDTDYITINNFLSISGVTDVTSFKTWTVRNEMYYSYAVQNPMIMSNLTDDQIDLLFNDPNDSTNIVVYNYPIYNMIFKLEGLYPVEFVTPIQHNVSRNVGTSVNGIMYMLHPDGTININGRATDDSYYTINTDFNSSEFAGYLFNGFSNTSIRVSVRITNVDYSTVYQEIKTNDEAIVDNGSGLYYSIFVPKGQLITNYVLSPMLRSKDEVSSAYEPYQPPYYGIIRSDEKNVEVGRYSILRSYEWGKLYNKYTHNFISSSNYYDIELHNYFGNYLRALRDVKGIDLMPYYNIYSGDYISNYRITDNGLEEYYNNTYKLLRVPIKYNKKYTIAIDCPSQVLMCPALFSKNIPLVIKAGAGSGIDVDMTERLNTYGSYVRSFDSLSFTSPVVFSVDNTSLTSTYRDLDCAYFYQYERDLVLLIQLPVSNDSSIVILEGDYTDTESSKVVNDPDLWQLHEVELNRVFCSNLSLLQFSTKENYVYSDRMVEYLLWNVVNPHDPIDGNIAHVEELAPNLVPSSYTAGIWSNYVRSKLYKFSVTNPNSKVLDLNGFVDKDTEKLLEDQIFKY